MSTYKYHSTADLVPQLIRKGPTNINGFLVNGYAGTSRFLKFYDAAAVSDVVVGTTVPDFQVNTGSSGTLVMTALRDIHFEKGLVVVTTNLGALTDTGVPAVNDIVGLINYSLPGQR